MPRSRAPAPCRRPARPGPLEPLEHVGHVLRPDAGPLVLDVSVAPVASARTATATWPPAGCGGSRCRRGSSRAGGAGPDRRRPSPAPGRPRPGRPSAAGLASADAPSAATSPRSTRQALELDRARVGPGEQQQVLDERGQVADLGVDVVERRADLADRLVPVAPTGARRCSGSTVSGVRSSWLASAANSRWRRRAARWAASDSRIGTSARRA